MTVSKLKLITLKLGLTFQHFESCKTGPSWLNTWIKITRFQRLKRKRRHSHSHTIRLTSDRRGVQCINTSVSLLPQKRCQNHTKKRKLRITASSLLALKVCSSLSSVRRFYYLRNAVLRDMSFGNSPFTHLGKEAAAKYASSRYNGTLCAARL